MQLYFVQSSDRRGDGYMKDVVLNEVKKELTEKEMRNVLENICKYLNKEASLVERHINIQVYNRYVTLRYKK